MKPENILLDMEGHISIVDFGLSKTNIFDGDRTETFCGSLEYMPPELLAGIITFFLVNFFQFLSKIEFFCMFFACSYSLPF